MLIALQPIQCALNGSTASVLTINLEEEPAGILLLLVRRWRGAPPTPTAPPRAQSAPNGATASAKTTSQEGQVAGTWRLHQHKVSLDHLQLRVKRQHQQSIENQWLLMTSNIGDQLKKRGKADKTDVFLQTPLEDSHQEPRTTVIAPLTTGENGEAKRNTAPAQPLESYRGPVQTPL